MTNEQALSDPRVRAFLAVIRRSEGATYNTLAGGRTFSDMSRHPNSLNHALNSTAAGAYQFLIKTWRGLQQNLGLPDFSPHSQDLGAVELLRERGALPFIFNNDFTGAVHACRKEWASLPGAGYGQHEQKLSFLQGVYQKALQGAGDTIAFVEENPGAAGGSIAGVVIFACLLGLIFKEL